MARISYRSKLRMKKFLRFLLITLGVLLAFSVVLLIYAEPFVIYDREGAHLQLGAQDPLLQEGPPPTDRPVITDPQILYTQDPVAEKNIAELGGFYITTQMLREPAAVLSALQALEEPCAVMMEVKSIYGNFYYSTDIPGAPRADVELTAIDGIITYLRENYFYMIAVVPAFCDPAFALEHQSCGLPLSSGALWMDSNGCYWLDPADETVLAYLTQICGELDTLGFREVAFSQFSFPDTSRIVYPSEQTVDERMATAAQALFRLNAGSELTLSFVTERTDFPTGDCACRLYFPEVDGSQVERYALAYEPIESLKEIVFLANSRDTRFEGHAQLRPLLAE